MISGLARGLRLEDHPAWPTVMQFRAATPLHEWTAQHRLLSPRTTAPGLSGPWRWENAPVMLDPYVVYSDVRVQSVAVCGCTQYGKSEFGHNVLAWTTLCDPAPLLLVMPTEDEVKNRVAIRLRELFSTSPDLLAAIGGDPRNIHVDRATDCRSCLLYLGWPNSPVTLGDKAVGRVILDELKNFPTEIKDHGDPVALARDRLRTFGAFGKLLSVSSPTTAESLIARELERGDYRRAYLPCPHCAVYQYPAWENVAIDRDPAGALLAPDDYAAGGRARYVCPHCRAPWTEADRLRALYKVLWLPAGVTAAHARPGVAFDELPSYDAVAGWTHRYAPADLPAAFPAVSFSWGDTTPPAAPPSTVSYADISALHLHPNFETLARVVFQWAQAEGERLRGDPSAMRVFINNQLGREYTDAAATFDEARLAKRRGDYAVGSLPPPGPGSLGPELVTVGLDVHAANIVAACWAWGYGAEAWLVTATTIHVSDSRDPANWQPVTLWLQALAAVLATYQGPPGPGGVRPGLRINFGLVDHRYQATAVETWCARVAGLWPIEPAEGIEDRPLAALIQTSRLSAKRQEQTRRSRRRRLDPTMPVQRLNVNHLKDRFARLLENEGDGPGRIHFPTGLPADFPAQFASEVRVPIAGRQNQYRWIPRYKGLDNHYWDVTIYAYAAALLAGVTNLLAPDQRVTSAPIRLSDYRPA